MSLFNITAANLLPPLQQVENFKAKALSLIVTQITHSALRALLEKRLFEFDAPVGDNSCKIRAAIIPEIAEKIEDLGSKQEVDQLLQKVSLIEEKIKQIIPEKTKTKCTLPAFRACHDIEFSLTAELHFLIQVHFLFKVRKPGVYDETDPTLLKEIGQSTAKDWIHQMKVRVAQASVSFVQKKVEELDLPRKVILQTMCSAPFIKWYEKRPVLPNVHCMEVIFSAALKQARIVIFKIAQWIDKIQQEDVVFLTQGNPSSNALEPRKVTKDDLEKPAIIITCRRVMKKETFSEIQQKLLNENLLELLIASAAQDPQYLEGKRAEAIPFEDYSLDNAITAEAKRFRQLNSIAVEKGVAAASPVYFVIEHIFADIVRNHCELAQEHHPWQPQWSNWMGDDLNVEPGSWLRE